MSAASYAHSSGRNGKKEVKMAKLSKEKKKPFKCALQSLDNKKKYGSRVETG